MPSPVVNQRIHNETESHHSVSEVLAAVWRAAQELEALSQSPAQPSCSLEDCGHTTLEKMKLLTALFKHGNSGNSLAVRWLGLGDFSAIVWVQSLVRELRFCKLCGKPPKILDYKFFIRYMFCLWKQIKIQKVLHEVFHFNVIYNCDEIGKKLQSNKKGNCSLPWNSKEYFSHLLTLKI